MSPPTDYQTAPPSGLIVSLPLSSIRSLRISPSQLLNTPKSTPTPLTPPPLAPSQPSKQSSPLAINLDLVELIFSTPPTSPHPFFNALKDLPPRTTNPPPLRPSFDTIERLANQPPPLPAMELPLPPLLPQHPPLGPNNPFPLLTHEMFCGHCQRTQVAVNDLGDEMRFILNHILERLNESVPLTRKDGSIPQIEPSLPVLQYHFLLLACESLRNRSLQPIKDDRQDV
ncbi:hypothetical protein Tco_0343318 [Tanacetum coccineum]